MEFSIPPLLCVRVCACTRGTCVCVCVPIMGSTSRVFTLPLLSSQHPNIADNMKCVVRLASTRKQMKYDIKMKF